MKSFTVEEVAAEHLPETWKDPVRWMKRRLASGEIPGKRLNRTTWVMTEADVEKWLTSRTATPVAAPADAPVVDLADGLSERSRRRLQKTA